MGESENKSKKSLKKVCWFVIMLYICSNENEIITNTKRYEKFRKRNTGNFIRLRNDFRRQQ